MSICRHARAREAPKSRRMSNGALVLATSTMIIRAREFFQFNTLSNDKARTKVSGDGGSGVGPHKEGKETEADWAYGRKGQAVGSRLKSREACESTWPQKLSIL